MEVVETEKTSSGSSDPDAGAENEGSNPDDSHGNDEAGGHDSDGDDMGLRKSKRSNRGQRYKELISQGIINPMRKKSESR